MDDDGFWDDSDPTMTDATPVTDQMVEDAERVLGYRLPAAYVKLIKTKNGGAPRNDSFPTTVPTSWARDHIKITGICGLGGTWGIDSESLGSRYLIREWGYPEIGVIICQCPSAGHDAVMLDYTDCGPQGEPRVVHVEVESDEPVVTFLTENFQKFLDGLVSSQAFGG